MSDKTPEEIAEGLSPYAADVLVMHYDGEEIDDENIDSLSELRAAGLLAAESSDDGNPVHHSTDLGRAVADVLAKRAEVSRGA